MIFYGYIASKILYLNTPQTPYTPRGCKGAPIKKVGIIPPAQFWSEFEIEFALPSKSELFFPKVSLTFWS